VASIWTQNSAESEGCSLESARNSNMGNTVRPIQPAPNQQATLTSSHDEFRRLFRSLRTIVLTIAASFINLRRSTVEVILGDKHVLLSHKIRGHTIFLFGKRHK
jgi:hypothetical protein